MNVALTRIGHGSAAVVPHHRGPTSPGLRSPRVRAPAGRATHLPVGDVTPEDEAALVGWLTGWRLTFGGEEHGWDGALATIVEDPFEQVFVAVYDVTPEDEAALVAWLRATSPTEVPRRRGRRCTPWSPRGN